jgi:hypothetical protein
MDYRPIASPATPGDAIVGAKTSNYSGHGLTLERPRGLKAAMSNMGKILAVSPHKGKKKKNVGGLYITIIFRAGLLAPNTSGICSS